jgi:DNA-binding MarR family transcriptional regulator
MNTIEKIMKNEKKCKRFLGLSNQQIDVLIARLTPLWKKNEEERLSRFDRKRVIGGGRQFAPTALKNMLVTCLLYYKLYLTQEFIGILFDVDQSTISRIISRLSKLIERAADPELETILQKTKDLKKHRIRNFIELQRACPDLADVITDASETPCNRPVEKDVQKKFYSGKQKTHTIKTQITINSNKRVIGVSDSYPGSIHDKSILDQDGTIKKIPPQARHILDKGYVGTNRENPTSNILIPIKKKRGQKELPAWAKQINKYLSKHRIAIEHVLSKIKNFRICSYTYRGRREDFNQIFKNIVALYNFNCVVA